MLEDEDLKKLAKSRRGFGAWPAEKQREAARKGGIAAHKRGTAHRWTTKEAQAAGRKGGAATHAKRRAEKAEKAKQATKEDEQ